MMAPTRGFEQTVQQLESICRLLVCTKCQKLPKEKVWTLGPCLHKYCEDCAEELCGQKCVACDQVGYPKDAKPDLFFTSFLSKLPSVYMTMKGLEEMSQEEEEEKQESEIENELEGLSVADFEETFYDEAANLVQENPEQRAVDPYEFDDAEEDKLIFANVECTPKGDALDKGGISQDFLEETPQNKARGRNSLTSGLALPVRNLTFPSQGPVETKETPSKSVISPGKDFKSDSDEELFRSQPRGTSPAPADIPILTPYQDASKKKTARKSDESGPPALTPHKSDSKEEVSAPVQEPLKRGLRSRKTSTSSLSSKTPKGRKAKMQQELDTSEVTPARRRRNSSTSVASSASSTREPRSSTEKRNAKGETALHIACRAGVMAKVQTLIDSGADVNAKDNAGWTPMHEVMNGRDSIQNKAEILRYVCEHGGDVNALGGLDEDTPLHCAVQYGLDTLVEILLEFGASPNIRNARGKLPKDCAFNEVIVKLFEEKMRNSKAAVVTPCSTRSKNPNLKSKEPHSASSVVDEDPAVLQVMLKKAVIYFNYDVDSKVVQATKTKLGLNVSEYLTCKVTHVVHQLTDSSARVPLSMEYLYAIAYCMWQVGSNWITNSLKNGRCDIPSTYEILGHQATSSDEKDGDEMVPGLSRINREQGKPGLLDGFSLYLYKTCGFTSPSLILNKRQLADLITAAGGVVINREPNPDAIDPLEAPQRFHALNNSRDEDDSQNCSKFTLTTHIILYDERSPPPQSKLYQMEHVKSLKSAWLVDSLSHFRLEEPEKYL